MNRSRWADPISIRLPREKDVQVREKAEKKGLSAGLYIRTVVLEHLEKK